MDVVPTMIQVLMILLRMLVSLGHPSIALLRRFFRESHVTTVFVAQTHEIQARHHLGSACISSTALFVWAVNNILDVSSAVLPPQDNTRAIDALPVPGGPISNLFRLFGACIYDHSFIGMPKVSVSHHVEGSRYCQYQVFPFFTSGDKFMQSSSKLLVDASDPPVFDSRYSVADNIGFC